MGHFNTRQGDRETGDKGKVKWRIGHFNTRIERINQLITKVPLCLEFGIRPERRRASCCQLKESFKTYRAKNERIQTIDKSKL
jgi:hypothetical protein